MIGILLITHGQLGNSLIDIVGHILQRPPENMAHISVHWDQCPDDLSETASQLLNKLDTGDGVIVFTDIEGASPSNLARDLLKSHNNIIVLAGLNLPMLLRSLTYRHLPLSDVVQKAREGGLAGITTLCCTNPS